MISIANIFLEYFRRTLLIKIFTTEMAMFAPNILGSIRVYIGEQNMIRTHHSVGLILFKIDKESSVLLLFKSNTIGTFDVFQRIRGEKIHT